MTTEYRRSRVLVGSGVMTLALLASACSGGGSDSAASVPILTMPETAVVTTEPATTLAATTAPRPEAADALAAAVASLGTRYAFRSDITTAAGDQVAVVGTRVDDASMFSIEAGGATVDVIVVAGAVWIRQDGSDEWLPSDDAPATDPLQPLAAPLALSWDATDPTRLNATYASTALGLGGTENVDVQIVPTAETLTFESNSGTTHLLTTLHPAPDAAPIQPPVG